MEFNDLKHTNVYNGSVKLLGYTFKGLIFCNGTHVAILDEDGYGYILTIEEDTALEHATPVASFTLENEDVKPSEGPWMIVIRNLGYAPQKDQKIDIAKAGGMDLYYRRSESIYGLGKMKATWDAKNPTKFDSLEELDEVMSQIREYWKLDEGKNGHLIPRIEIWKENNED